MCLFAMHAKFSQVSGIEVGPPVEAPPPPDSLENFKLTREAQKASFLQKETKLKFGPLSTTSSACTPRRSTIFVRRSFCPLPPPHLACILKALKHLSCSEREHLSLDTDPFPNKKVDVRVLKPSRSCVVRRASCVVRRTSCVMRHAYKGVRRKWRWRCCWW